MLKKFKKEVPKKVLRYFSLIPRLKRLFQSPQTTQNLTSHANKRIRDGNLHRQLDLPVWQLIDNKWP